MSNEKMIYSDDNFKNLNIQDKILELNNNMLGGRNGALRIPIDILYNKDIDDKEKLKQFFIRNHKKKFTKNKPLHPNLLRYLNEEGICEPFRDKKDEHYLKSKIDGDNSKIFISKANLFGYELINKFRDSRKFERFFDAEGYFYGLKMELQMPVGYDYKNRPLTRKLDFAFDVGGKEEKCKYLSLEFFEAYHENNDKYNSTYEHTRLGELLKMDNNCEAECEKFLSFLVIWDCHWRENENYKDGWIKIFVDKIKKYDNINNEEERIANILNNDIGNIELSRILTKAFSKENRKKCVINFDRINKLYPIKDEIENQFIEEFKDYINSGCNMTKKSSIYGNDDDEDSDFKSTRNEISQDQFYYIDENDKMYLSDDGFVQYMGLIKKDDMYDLDKFWKKNELVRRLGNSVIEAIRTLNKLRDNLRKELLIGLDHLHNLPEEFRDKEREENYHRNQEDDIKNKAEENKKDNSKKKKDEENENKKQAESCEKKSKSKSSNGVCKKKEIKQEASKNENKKKDEGSEKISKSKSSNGEHKEKGIKQEVPKNKNKKKTPIMDAIIDRNNEERRKKATKKKSKKKSKKKKQENEEVNKLGEGMSNLKVSDSTDNHNPTELDKKILKESKKESELDDEIRKNS